MFLGLYAPLSIKSLLKFSHGSNGAMISLPNQHLWISGTMVNITLYHYHHPFHYYSSISEFVLRCPFSSQHHKLFESQDAYYNPLCTMDRLTAWLLAVDKSHGLQRYPIAKFQIRPSSTQELPLIPIFWGNPQARVSMCRAFQYLILDAPTCPAML